MTVTDIAIVGVGKIARDQHIPAIGKHPGFRLAATVSRSGGVEGVENFATLADLLAARPDIAAIALCNPPQVRFNDAWTALTAGRHVLLEKPPGASVAECHALDALAAARGLTLFASWHSRHAGAVGPARAWLSDRRVRGFTVTWKEDVRRWHPGQAWIWEPGGAGIFDPGINALSILTAILPAPVHLTGATLEFPANRATPIAARLAFAGPDGVAGTADLDWRQTGPQTWDISVETEGGRLDLTGGGRALAVDGQPGTADPTPEYDALYARFADLLATGARDVDLAPLVHVADAFMLGRRAVADPFHD